ncbi:MAG: hypothetical protein H0U16_04720 [Actinobacteria bacterium]|nr:hypothetical protein [Actinomycetota bacterium]
MRHCGRSSEQRLNGRGTERGAISEQHGHGIARGHELGLAGLELSEGRVGLGHGEALELSAHYEGKVFSDCCTDEGGGWHSVVSFRYPLGFCHTSISAANVTMSESTISSASPARLSISKRGDALKIALEFLVEVALIEHTVGRLDARPSPRLPTGVAVEMGVRTLGSEPAAAPATADAIEAIDLLHR